MIEDRLLTRKQEKILRDLFKTFLKEVYEIEDVWDVFFELKDWADYTANEKGKSLCSEFATFFDMELEFINHDEEYKR